MQRSSRFDLSETAKLSPEHRVLWDQLQTLAIDRGDVTFPFEARLARDNGWSRNFSVRVVEEYRRFLFLGQVAGHPVTPSDEVDQAWHLHLTYTRSYWDDLCSRILGGPFHHGPTEGGAAEGAKFDDWYARTLASYRAWFGTEPPSDIWPRSEIRFGEASNYVRINTTHRWVVPKPGPSVAGRAVLVGASASGLTGCLFAAQVESEGSGGIGWVLLAALVCGLAFIAFRIVRGGLDKASGGTTSGNRRRSDSSDAALWGLGLFGGGSSDDDSNSGSDGGSDSGSDGGGDGGGGGCGGGGCGGCGG